MIKHFDEIRDLLHGSNSLISRVFRKPRVPKIDGYVCGFDSVLKELITPDQITEHWNDMEYGDQHHVVIGAAGYPGVVSHGWLYGLINDTRDIQTDFSQFITPIDKDESQRQAERFLNRLLSDTALMEKNNKTVPESLANKIIAIKEKINKMEKGTEKSFKISVYIKTSAENKSILAQQIGIIKSKLNGLMIVPSVLTFRHLPAHECMMPICSDRIGMFRHMDTTSSARSILLPGRARVDSHQTDEGTIIGVEYDSDIPVVFNRFDPALKNANVLVLAGSGAGKTFATTLDIMHQVEIGNAVSIIDPKNDYSNIVNEFNGEVIEIKEGSNTIMNPYQLGTSNADSLATKLQELPAFYEMLVGADAVTAAVKPIIDVCDSKIYTDRMITDDPDTWFNEPPILSEFYESLIQFIEGDIQTRFSTTEPERVAGKAFAAKIRPFCEGAYKSFFNGQTTVDVEGDLISYNLLSVPKMIKSPVMYQILTQQFNYMTARERGYRTLYLDEAWDMLSSNSEHIKRIVKTCRGFGMSMETITQDLADVTGSHAGSAILGNTDTTFLYSIKTAFKDPIKKMFGLTLEEADFLTRCKKGEGIVISGGNKTKIKTPSAPAEKKLIEIGTEVGIVQQIDRFDSNAVFHACKDLSPGQMKILSDKSEYVRTTGPLLGRGSGDYYINNTTGNQGSDHFIMTHLIHEKVKSLGLESQIFDYGMNCDVVIENKYRSVLGFEVETGTNNKKDLLEKVNRLNNMSEQNKGEDTPVEWFFVVPSKFKKQYSEVHSNTITSGEVVPLITEFANQELNLVMNSAL